MKVVPMILAVLLLASVIGNLEQVSTASKRDQEASKRAQLLYLRGWLDGGYFVLHSIQRTIWEQDVIREAEERDAVRKPEKL